MLVRMQQFRREVRCGFMLGHTWRVYTRNHRKCENCGRIARGKTY